MALLVEHVTGWPPGVYSHVPRLVSVGFLGLLEEVRPQLSAPTAFAACPPSWTLITLEL